jgi:hypothetical protein
MPGFLIEISMRKKDRSDRPNDAFAMPGLYWGKAGTFPPGPFMI